jgi:hypothetical protein
MIFAPPFARAARRLAGALLVSAAVLAFASAACAAEPALTLTPAPAQATLGQGTFALTARTRIFVLQRALLFLLLGGCWRRKHDGLGVTRRIGVRFGSFGVNLPSLLGFSRLRLRFVGTQRRLGFVMRFSHGRFYTPFRRSAAWLAIF